MRTVLPRQTLSLPPFGQFTSREVKLHPQTAALTLRAGREVTGGAGVDWPADSRVRMKIGVRAGHETIYSECKEVGGVIAGPAGEEAAEAAMTKILPVGWFGGVREGFQRRIGEGRSHFTAWVEFEVTSGPGVETWVELESEEAPAPEVRWHSSIAHVQSGVTTNTTSTSYSESFSATTAGSLMAAGVTGRLGDLCTGVSDSDGSYTEHVQAVNGTDASAWIFSRPNSSGGVTSATVTFSSSPFSSSITVAEYSGAATSSPLDETDSGTGFGTAVATGSLFANGAGVLMVSCAKTVSGGACTPTTNWNERIDTGNNHYQDRIFTTGAAGDTPAITAGSSSNWAMVAAGFRRPTQLPFTTGLTLHVDASDAERVFTTYSATGLHTTAPADGGNVQAWDDDGWGISDVVLAEATTYPLYRSGGSALMKPSASYGEIDFDGTNDFLGLGTQTFGATMALSGVFDADGWTVTIAFYGDTIANNTANLYENDGLMGTNDAYFLIYVRNSGGQRKVGCRVTDTAPAEEFVEGNINVNQTHVVTVRYDNTNLDLWIDGTLADTEASGQLFALTGPLRVGLGYTGYFNGRIGEIAMFDAALSDVAVGQLNDYMTDKWLTAAAKAPPPMVMHRRHRYFRRAW